MLENILWYLGFGLVWTLYRMNRPMMSDRPPFMFEQGSSKTIGFIMFICLWPVFFLNSRE
jgi:hypothetical protein